MKIVERIDELAKVAAKGPWVADRGAVMSTYIPPGRQAALAKVIAHDLNAADAEIIVQLYSNWPAIRAVLVAAEKVVAPDGDDLDIQELHTALDEMGRL